MRSIRSSTDLELVLTSFMDPHLRRLLTLRRDQRLVDELSHFIVVQPGDTLEQIEAEAGIPIATSPVDTKGEPAFEWVERHPGQWLEAPIILTDEGACVVLLVPDRIDVEPRLLLLLTAHA